MDSMRIVRSRSIPNVDSDRLVADLARLSHRIVHDDQPRGEMVRMAAKRSLIVHELNDRGVDHGFDGPVGSRAACAAVFA